jgi:hypothetical protein
VKIIRQGETLHNAVLVERSFSPAGLATSTHRGINGDGEPVTWTSYDTDFEVA